MLLGVADQLTQESIQAPRWWTRCSCTTSKPCLHSNLQTLRPVGTSAVADCCVSLAAHKRRPRNRPCPFGLCWSAVVTNSAKVRLPKKLSLCAQGSVWVESSESPWIPITVSKMNADSNWIDNSNTRIKQETNVLKQILERPAKRDLWKHKRAAKLAINTSQLDAAIAQMAWHEFKQTNSGVVKNHQLELVSTGCKFFAAEKIRNADPIWASSSCVKSALQREINCAQQPTLPSWWKTACRAAKYFVALEPRVIHRR